MGLKQLNSKQILDAEAVYYQDLVQSNADTKFWYWEEDLKLFVECIVIETKPDYCIVQLAETGNSSRYSSIDHDGKVTNLYSVS